MGSESGGVSEWPIAVWIVLFGVGVLVGRYAFLRWQQSRNRTEEAAAERRLLEAASRLREYATAHLQRLPAAEEVGGLFDGSVAYRPVPRLTLDERLILVHDAQPVRRIVEFPALREGRGVVLCSGRVLVVTESAFARLIEADNALRQRLGLAPIA
ncbi:MAG TPA: hypothetical protein PL151_09165 [Phycisphaerae bacterium]|nr:hypothetical protein [Phycisphaerae bacterium]HOM50282.1 hypothetical protein [Phycisphaerae bacterium]HON67963.1 hypothetical protein [Phycisphaerae bacterium]HOQ84876.1 hypothetical protein [Phycisphaerae bacterium]HPP27587.1 hypothetical protein [Phycisphaerae bacterium]